MTPAFWHRQIRYPFLPGVMGVLALAFTAYAHKSTGKELLGAWLTDEYSHGIIVPFIALLLAWHGLTRLRPVAKPSWWCVPVLIFSGFLLLVGMLAAFEAAAEYGLIFSLIGLSLGFFGCAATSAMAPGFVYLFFIVPLPHIVYSALSQQLQLISSTLGAWCLELLAIPVFQEGNVIDLGGYKLQVADACSGLRYLFPLMSFGYLVAYMLDDRLWKRLFIFCSAVPIAIGMNALRIAFVGVTVDVWGTSMAEGFLHAFEGWVVFLLCVALLMAEVWILLRVKPGGKFRLEYLGPAHGAWFAGYERRIGPPLACFLLTGAFACLFGASFLDKRAEIVPVHPPFFTFPLKLDEWHGRQLGLDPDILQGLQLSDYWIADYARAQDKAPVNFYMAYYLRQRVGSEAHSPANCIPGGGWQIMNDTVISIGMPDGQSLLVSRLLIDRAGTRQLVYYWFDERGRDITDTYRAKWYLLWDAVAMHRTDGALIRFSTPLNAGESEKDADERIKVFLTAAYPAILRFVPGGAEQNSMIGQPTADLSGSRP